MHVVVNSIKEDVPVGSESLNGQKNYHHNILLCLGYKPDNLPLANFLALYQQLPGRWLVASPIHWQATHNDAMIVANGQELELTEQESRLWFSEVAQFLHADQFTPVFHDAHTWLFKIDDKPQITSQSPLTILHQSIMPILTRLDTSFYWQRLITELQMYLTAHPLNEKRQPKLAINGLWFWGEAEFSFSGNRTVVTDDEVLLNHTHQFSPLTPMTVIKKNHLVIINDPKQIEFCNLTAKMRKNKVHWYWNNLAYCTKVSWWSRIRGY